MNPWAGLIVVVAVLLIIVAWKGTQDNVIAALLNRPYKNSTVGGSSGTASTAPADFPVANPNTVFGNVPVTSV